jgi:prepilin peptidase CpaA
MDLTWLFVRRNMNIIEIVRIICLFALVIIAAYTDMTRGKIYNWLTIPGIIFGPILSLTLSTTNQSRFSLISSLIGITLGGGIFIIFYLLRQMGGGDVKLMAAVGGLVGYPVILIIIFYTAIVGGILAAGLLIWHRQRWQALLKSVFSRMRGQIVEHNSACLPLTMPYGLAIALGTMWTYIYLLNLPH